MKAHTCHPELGIVRAMDITPSGTMFAVCDHSGSIEVCDILENEDICSRWIVHVRCMISSLNL